MKVDKSRENSPRISSLPFVHDPLSLPFPEGATQRLLGLDMDSVSRSAFLTTIPFIFDSARDEIKWLREGQGWYQALSGIANGRQVLFVKTQVGASNVLDCLCFLRICGVEVIVFVGLCGGLLSGADHGDLFMPGEVVRLDLVSEVVATRKYPAAPDTTLSQRLSHLVGTCPDVALRSTGPLASLTALCQETTEVLQMLRDDGVDGVDLESAAFLTACSIWGIRAVSLLVVSDRPLDGDYLIADDKPSKKCLDSARSLTSLLLSNANDVFR